MPDTREVMIDPDGDPVAECPHGCGHWIDIHPAELTTACPVCKRAVAYDINRDGRLIVKAMRTDADDRYDAWKRGEYEAP